MKTIFLSFFFLLFISSDSIAQTRDVDLLPARLLRKLYDDALIARDTVKLEKWKWYVFERHLYLDSQLVRANRYDDRGKIRHLKGEIKDLNWKAIKKEKYRRKEIKTLDLIEPVTENEKIGPRSKN